MRRSLPILCFAAAVTAVPAHGADDDSVPRGALAFEHLCARCHSGHQSTAAQAVMAAAGAPDVIRSALRTIGAMQPLAPLVTPGMADDIAAWLAVRYGPAPDMPVRAVEFHHRPSGAYFFTAVPAEIGDLDAGSLVGWTRTGQAFRVYAAATGATLPVCRFFGAGFAPDFTHFYTASPAECAMLRSGPVWQYEGDVFHVVPVGADGACPGASSPVHRLYNNGLAGTPRHHFTTDSAIRDDAVARGWLAEGVAFCSVD